jgi:hypothetical protein
MRAELILTPMAADGSLHMPRRPSRSRETSGTGDATGDRWAALPGGTPTVKIQRWCVANAPGIDSSGIAQA